MEYNPLNWYWFVGTDTTQLYSSAAGNYVPVTDSVYLAWKALGGRPTTIDSEDSLGDVLSQYYPDVKRPTVPSMIGGYQKRQADDLFRRKSIKILFVLLNRIQVLEGKQPMTVAQARAYVKGLM